MTAHSIRDISHVCFLTVSSQIIGYGGLHARRANVITDIIIQQTAADYKNKRGQKKENPPSIEKSAVVCYNSERCCRQIPRCGKEQSMNNADNNGIIGKFSVGLGLFDYINPILYGVTSVIIITHMHGVMPTPLFLVYMVGAALSLLFGLTIPTVKLIVGLGKMQFKMPVNLVSYVNTGILISGIALISYVLGLSPLTVAAVLLCAAAVIAFLWYKTGKFNTAAVLIGAVGYLMLYVSLITLSVRAGMTVPIVLYALAIFLFVFLCLVGILSNLKNASVHWVIEISNVICQFSVAFATVLLFCR